MSFYTIENPLERDRTIREYLAIKKHIQKRNMDERVGDMRRSEDLEESYRPFIESNEKTMSTIDKMITPLESQLQLMNENIESSDAIKQVSSDADQYYGLVNNKISGLMMGVKRVELVDGDQLRIDSTVYNLTNGLWALITKKNPTNYTSKDYDAYKALVHHTDVINHPSNTTKNSRPRNTLKFRNILSKMLVQENESSGHGINFLPADINSLVTKLQVLVGEFLAGNKTTRSQIVAILDNLKERKKISETEYIRVNHLLQ